MRSYWKGDGGIIGEFAQRLTGSSDLYERSGRRPHASINFITCHDGFTLHDLVTYNEKHNVANLEGEPWVQNTIAPGKCGIEGETAICRSDAARASKRNFIGPADASLGCRMISSGDVLGPRQAGNNNAYCQDNGISWYDWTMTPEKERLLAFFVRMIRLRRQHPIFHRRNFFHGRAIRGSAVKDIVWLNPDGAEMNDAEWREAHARSSASI